MDRQHLFSQESAPEEEREQSRHTMTPVLIVAYFLLLSILIIPAMRLHWGMPGIIGAMIGAGIVLALLVLLYQWCKRAMTNSGLSRRQVMQMAVGYSPTHLADETEEENEEEEAIASSSPLSPVSDRIIEEHPLHLSALYQPSVKSFLGATVAIIGMRRSGKSNLLAVLAEELAQYALPFVLFDTESEYSALVDERYLQRPVLVGSSERAKDYASERFFVALDTEGAYAFGQAVMQSGLQVVVDLRSFEEEDGAIVMSEMIDGIEDWQQARPNADRVPVTILLDESQKWFPQNREDKVVSSDVQSMLDQAFYGTVVARGGKRGFGLVVAAQRYSQLNKKLLQSQHKFLFFQNEQIDLERYRKLGIPPGGTVSLAQGQCYCFGPSVIGMRVMVRARHSPHGGHTPGLENLTRHTRQLAPVAEVLHKSYAKTTRVLAPPALDPSTHQREPTQLEQALETSSDIALGKECAITRQTYAIALRLRKSGMSTGYRDLMEPFDLSEHHAKVLNKLILDELKGDARA